MDNPQTIKGEIEYFVKKKKNFITITYCAIFYC